jgi:protein-tyrosine-phosphatase/predicted ATP-grasp superfamily ATP-dependent carboligase
MSDRTRPGRVLVLGRETRAFLAVIRSLGRRGLEVHVGWCPPGSLALESRYVSRVHDLPAYSPTDDAWRDAFVALCRAEQFDLVIPTNDATVVPLQVHRAALEPHARIYLLAQDAFDVTFDKVRTYELAERAGVPLPRQLVLPMPVAPEAIGPDWFPLVLKPRTSYRLDDLQRKQVVRRVRRAEDLPRQLAAYGAEREIVVQQWVRGTGVGVEMLAADGDVLLAFQHMRVHERREGGADSYRVSQAVDPELREAAARMVRALRYTGVVMFEFRVDRTTGDWVLLEINGRFWASLPLCLYAGADFPWHLYQLVVHGRRSVPQHYRVGVTCRNWDLDLLWLDENRRAPGGERVPWTTLLREATSILRLRESSDTFVLDDPGPGLADLGRLARRFGNRIVRGLQALPAARRREAARAERALREARDVLFVCRGNICRSPFAEVVARAALDDGRRVTSAGLLPMADRPCEPEGVTAARELGIDLTAHRSRVVTDAMMRDAQAIFTFDAAVHDEVARRFPDARDRLYHLGVLAPSEPIDIGDPYGGTVAQYRETYARIRRAITG